MLKIGQNTKLFFLNQVEKWVKSAIMLKTGYYIKGIIVHGIYISGISRVLVGFVKITSRENFWKIANS